MLGALNKYLRVPEATLGTCPEDRVLPLHRILSNVVNTSLFLLEGIHQGHGLVCLGQVGQLWILKYVLIVDRGVLVRLERLDLQIRVLF